MTIIEELRQNRESGAKRLEAEYKAGLMTLARRFCVDEGDAAELVNRTFAAVVEGIDDYLEQSAFFAWMCQILSNIHSLDTRRMFHRNVVYPGTVPETTDEGAHEEIYRNLDASMVREAIQLLSKDQREMLLLHYFAEMPVSGIAKFLSIPVGTVNSRLHYARKALAAKLGVAAKRPGVKALLIALALAALTAIGAVVATALGDARNTSPAPVEDAPLAEEGCDAQDSSHFREGAAADSSTHPVSPTTSGDTMNAKTLRTIAASAALTAAAGATLPSGAFAASPSGISASVTGAGALPDAYLDYVESSGSQYIDTGVTGRSGTRMVAEMEWAEWAEQPSEQSTFCGAYDGSTYVVTPYTSDGEKHQVGYARNSQYQVGGSGKPTPDIRFRVETTLEAGSQSFNVRALDGSGYNATRTHNDAADLNLGCPLYLFARNDSGTANQYSSARVFSLMLWQKDGNDWQLVRHFLPCRKDNRAALYDKVEGVIYFPQGGELVAGATLPRPAELVEWVQSDGASSDRRLYIDTGIPAKAGTGMTAELLWPVKPSSIASTVCGAMSDSTNHFTLYTSAGTHQIGYAKYSAFQVDSGTSVVYAGKRYRVTSSLAARAQNLQVEDLDGTGYNGTRFFNDANSIDASNSLYLFARNDAGTPNNFAAVRLYSLVLTNDLGVVRDFLPCVADNGRAGLYDRFSERVFFPQAAAEGATAEFSLATEVGAVTNLPATTKWPRIRPQWIEANGMNDYVDLDVVARDGTRMLAEVEWNDTSSAATFCGAATNSYSGLFSTYRVTSDFHRMGYYNGSSTLGGASCAPVVGVRYRVETSLGNGEQVITVAKKENNAWVPVGNGTRTEVLSFPAGFANLGIPLYLFARNKNGVADEFAAVRLYSFKLWQGGELIRDLYPVFDCADNAPALFDKVSKSYFRNNGGYRLTAGGETMPFPGQALCLIVR